MEAALCDLAAATVSAVFVTPVVAAVDKAIPEAAAGKATLLQSFVGTLRSMVSLQAVRRPEFLYVWALFAGTYSVNNLVCSAEQHTDTSMPKTKTTSVFLGNMSLAMWKDAAFARIFGGAASPQLPLRSYGAWAVRDLTGMSVVFTLPPLLAPKLAEATDLSRRSAETVCQFVLPMAIQPVVAPFHQLGFLVSFKPDAPLTDHLAVIRQQLPGVVVMRWIRGFPPYCVGATMNKNLRFELRTLFGLNTDPPEANAVPHYAANISRKLTPG